MWQAEDDDIQWAKKSYVSKESSGPHGDYDVNLRMAQNFINKVTPSLRCNMNISIRGSHGLDRSVLMISWNPPRNSPLGNYANPISLHQPNKSFSRSLEIVFNDYLRKVESFEKKYGHYTAKMEDL